MREAEAVSGELDPLDVGTWWTLRHLSAAGMLSVDVRIEVVESLFVCVRVPTDRHRPIGDYCVMWLPKNLFDLTGLAIATVAVPAPRRVR